MQVAEMFRPVLGDDAPVAIRAYDGSASAPAGVDPVATIDVRSGTALANMPAATGVEGLTQNQALLSLVVYTLLFAALGVSATVGRDVP